MSDSNNNEITNNAPVQSEVPSTTEPESQQPQEAAKVSDTSNSETTDAAKPQEETTKPEPAKTIPKHHFSKIDAFLSACAFLFIACAVGMVIPAIQPFALYGGYGVAFIFICGIFYATLHLQKV